MVSAAVAVLLAVVDLVSAVDPLIGTVSYPKERIDNVHGFGKTFPGAATPFGMVQLSPDTITGGDNGSGYSYSHNTIEGFCFLHMSGVGWYGEFGNFQVMVGGRGASHFSHTNEVAKAGYYRVRLDDVRTTVEATATPDAGLLRFTFAEGGEQTLTMDLARRICENAYETGPYGLCGNEDVGQMSAWYVLAAIGRLPLDPASGQWYRISSIFDCVELTAHHYRGSDF